MTVLATNVAETGITIPDITCVIDSGKHREMRFNCLHWISIYYSHISRFDEKRQISRLLETFIAKSNAAQRRGRAGRVRTGLCFHLFTKIRHETQVGHYQCNMTRHRPRLHCLDGGESSPRNAASQLVRSCPQNQSYESEAWDIH